MDYRQTIQVGRNATDILKLSCVMGCHKDDNDELRKPRKQKDDGKGNE